MQHHRDVIALVIVTPVTAVRRKRDLECDAGKAVAKLVVVASAVVLENSMFVQQSLLVQAFDPGQQQSAARWPARTASTVN